MVFYAAEGGKMSYGNPLIAAIVGGVTSLGTGIANAVAQGKTNQANMKIAQTQGEYNLAATRQGAQAATTTSYYDTIQSIYGYQATLSNAEAQQELARINAESSLKLQQTLIAIAGVGILAGAFTLIYLRRKS